MRLEVPPAPFYPGRDFFSGSPISLRVIHVEPSPPYPRHRHDFDELVVVYAGRGRHLFEGSEHPLGRGDVFLIPRGASHAYLDPEGLCYINVIFDIDILSAGASGSTNPEPPFLSFGRRAAAAGRYFRLSAFGIREVVDLINKIDRELFQKKEGYAFMARALFMQLWCVLARKYADPTENSGTVSARIGRIVDFLEREGGSDVSISDMAEEAGTCVRNFHREFRKATGSSPLPYINKIRIERACALLRDTERSVTQIAALVGYEDPNYFARQFKRLKGCSPMKYRSGEP